MKTIAIFFVAAALVVPVFAGPRSYQYGKVLSFDTGEGLAGRREKAEVVYRVQIGSTVYRVTSHLKKHEFAAGQDIECRIDKDRMFIEKMKGGEMKCDIVGEATLAQP